MKKTPITIAHLHKLVQSVKPRKIDGLYSAKKVYPLVCEILKGISFQRVFELFLSIKDENVPHIKNALAHLLVEINATKIEKRLGQKEGLSGLDSQYLHKHIRLFKFFADKSVDSYREETIADLLEEKEIFKERVENSHVSGTSFSSVDPDIAISSESVTIQGITTAEGSSLLKKTINPHHRKQIKTVVLNAVEIAADMLNIFPNLESVSIINCYWLPDNVFNGLFKLNSLSFWHCDFSKRVSSTIFAGLYSLEYFSIYNSNFYAPDSKIYKNLFKDLTQLQELRISQGVGFDTLVRGMFRHQKFLKRLEICYLVEEIEAGAFEGLSSLRFLNLHASEFAKISAHTFKGLTNLKEFRLGYNCCLKEVEQGAFDYFKNVEIFEFEYGVAVDPSIFKPMTKLKSLKYNHKRKVLPGNCF